MHMDPEQHIKAIKLHLQHGVTDAICVIHHLQRKSDPTRSKQPQLVSSAQAGAVFFQTEMVFMLLFYPARER